jgi:hypothetical protein
MEKRENKRHNSDTAVMCSVLTTLRCGEPVDGIMKNYGCGGMYAELHAHFKAGTILVVMMASHGRGGVKGLLLGSKTQEVLTHSRIPVLVYR